MKNPYLIQSAKFRKSSAKGIDGLLSFNYMGSAEFEFGALGKSLERIRSRALSFNATQLYLNGKHIVHFCHTDVQLEMPDMLENLVLGSFPLKEYCSFKDLISFDFFKCYDDLWWDIENDWIVWRFNEAFNSEFVDKIKGV